MGERQREKITRKAREPRRAEEKGEGMLKKKRIQGVKNFAFSYRDVFRSVIEMGFD